MEILKKERINIKATTQEKNDIKNKADSLGITMTRLLVEGALNAKVPDKNLLFLLRERKSEISRVGNNINQISRVLNKANKANVINSELFEDVLNELLIIKSEIREI